MSRYKKTPSFTSPNFIVLLLMIAAIPLTVLFLQQQQELRQRAAENAQFFLSPNKPKVAANQQLNISIEVNTGPNAIKGVQVNLVYPIEKLELLGIDADGSAFDAQSERIVGNGLIRLGREALYPVIGEKHVATLIFIAKQDVDATEVKSSPGSFVLKSTDNLSTISTAADVGINPHRDITVAKQSWWDIFLEKNASVWDTIITSISTKFEMLNGSKSQ